MSKNTEALIQMLTEREQRGIAKYGVTLDRTDLTTEQWLQHAIEELLDGAAYLQGLKRTLDDANREAADRVNELEDDIRRSRNYLTSVEVSAPSRLPLSEIAHKAATMLEMQQVVLNEVIPRLRRYAVQCQHISDTIRSGYPNMLAMERANAFSQVAAELRNILGE